MSDYDLGRELARADVERLERGLAAAAHGRDLAEERARLAADGAAQAQQRLERLRAEAERELAEAERRRQRDLAEAERRRESALAEAERRHGAAVAEIERRREAELAERDAASGRLRDRHERELAALKKRLARSEARAEHFRRSLVALREGRAYRLLRVLWRLRRPFRRAPRAAVPAAAAEDDADSSPRASIPRPPREPGAPLRVAAVLDEMSEACFAPECELVPLRLDGWAEQIDERHTDLLLVESAWDGSGGEWQYRVARYPRRDLAGLPALRALVEGCRRRGIPTAFWNKEDPVHFERFAEAASLFDHVFTTDARCVERYWALPGERTVAALPFAAQPRIHNPVAAVPERSSSPCFAGAWYRDRHPERRRALEALLDAARPRGLVIYDRRFGGDDGAFGFPARFAPHVLGGLPYERILDVYRSHRVFLNANSVVDSPTMCSRRVFELAACDTAILSTPGAAISQLLGAGLVAEAGEEAGAAAALERLLGDEAERRRVARAARRRVLAEHTYADRLATIAATAGLEAPGRGEDGWELIAAPGVALGEDARADLRAASVYADADVIGAHPARNGDAAIEHRRVDELDPGALLVRRELIAARGPLPPDPEGAAARLREWSDDGVRLYAADADLSAVSARPGSAI